MGSPGEEDTVCPMDPDGKPDGGLELPTGSGKEQRPLEGAVVAPVPKSEGKAAEIQKLRRLEQAGIKVMPAAQRFARLALLAGWLASCMPGSLESGWHVGIYILFSHFQLCHCTTNSCSKQIEIANDPCLKGVSGLSSWLFKWKQRLSFLLLE